MATRTSSPPGSRSKSTSTSRSRSSSAGKGRGGSSTRSRSARKPTRGRTPAKQPARRVPPRAVRNGPGPIARAGHALFRGVSAVWLGVAHAVGAGARGIGRTARDLDPDHRRDGAGLFLFGIALVVGAAVWFEMPGGVMELVRSIVTG